MTSTSSRSPASGWDIDTIVMRIKGEHRRCRVFIHEGSYDRAAEALRDGRALLGALLTQADFSSEEHRALVKDVGAQHIACSQLVCAARCIQADEALLQMRALHQGRLATRESTPVMPRPTQHTLVPKDARMPPRSRRPDRPTRTNCLPGQN